MFENLVGENKEVVKYLGGIRVEGVWMTGSHRWDNVVAFTSNNIRFYFWANDFGSLRAAFKAARDMKAGKSPEDFLPVVITQSKLMSAYIVRPEYVQTEVV